MHDIFYLTALTALQLTPVAWPEEAQQWREFPLRALTQLRQLALPTPSQTPECMNQSCLLGVFQDFSKLESVNCMGLKITGLELAALNNACRAPVWACMLRALGIDWGIAIEEGDSKLTNRRVIDLFYDAHMLL